MSGWKWKLRRAMAMSPGEIAVRAWRIARDRAIAKGLLRPYPIDPSKCFGYAWRENAIEIYQRFLQRFPCARFSHREWREFITRQHPAHADAVLLEAEAILNGRLRILGFEVQADTPPRWFRNYVQGGQWPALPARQIDYRRGDLAGGVRYCWELNRHGYFLTLAQAWFLTHEHRFAQRLLADWLDWIAQNPPRFGVNWTSMLECALRIHTWCWSLWFLSECDLLTDQMLRPILGSLWQQTAEIAMNLSIGSSANNHLIGEAAGMWTFSALFPSARHAQRWSRVAHRILSTEIPRQITADGVTVEQAVHYQVFVIEMALHAATLAKHIGESFGQHYSQRMQAGARFLTTLLDSGAHVPHIGDSDDAEVLPFCPVLSSAEYTMVDAVHAIVSQAPPTTVKGAFLSARPIRGEANTMLPAQSTMFAEGGYAVMRDAAGKRVAVVDYGELGWGAIAAHAHADALSITLSANAQPILVDAGTYCYHDEPDWRDAFRSTRYHNTVCVEGQDQSQMLGPFLWGERAHVRVHHWSTADLVDVLVASHDGYRRIGAGLHTRWFCWLKPDLWLVVDEVEQSDGRCVEQCWCFSQACVPQVAGDTMQMLCAGQAFWVVPVSPVSAHQTRAGAPREGGWVSPAFGKREPTTHLTLRRAGEKGRLATLLAIGEAAPEIQRWSDEPNGWELHATYRGKQWLVGVNNTPRTWHLHDTDVTAKSVAACWGVDGQTQYEVID